MSMPDTVSTGGRRDVADVHRAEQPVRDALVGVGVGVVHADGRFGDGEAVGVRLAAGHEVLGDRGDAVLVVGDVDAVPVDVGADRELVGDLDLDLVADVEIDARSGDHPVVRPGLHDLAGPDLPVDDRRRQFEALGAVGQDFGGERLVAEPLGLRRERHDRLDHRLVLLCALSGGGRVIAVPGRRRGAAGTPPAATDDELGRHAGFGVSGDRAVDLVRAGLQFADVELGARAGIEVVGDQVLSSHREVVDHRPVVADRQGAGRGDLRGRQVDGELRQVGLHRLAGHAAFVVIGGARTRDRCRRCSPGRRTRRRPRRGRSRCRG